MKNNGMIWFAIAAILLLMPSGALAFIEDGNYGFGTYGNVHFSTTTKNYGLMVSGIDYNVSGNTLYLAADRILDFTNFYLGPGTILSAQDSNGVLVYIRVLNDANIYGDVNLGQIITSGFNNKQIILDGNTFTRIGGGGSGGSGGKASDVNYPGIAYGTGGSGGSGSLLGFGGAGGGGACGTANGAASGGSGAIGGYPGGGGGSGGSTNVDYAESNGSNGGNYSGGGGGGVCAGSGSDYIRAGSGGSAYSQNGNNSAICDNRNGKIAGSGGSGGQAGLVPYIFILKAKNFDKTGNIYLNGGNGINGGNGSDANRCSAYAPGGASGGKAGGGGSGANGGIFYLTYENLDNNLGSFSATKGTKGFAGSPGLLDFGSTVLFLNDTNATNGSDGTSDGISYFNSASSLNILPPVTTFIPSQKKDTNYSTLSLDCDDDNGLCKKIYYKIDNGNWNENYDDGIIFDINERSVARSLTPTLIATYYLDTVNDQNIFYINYVSAQLKESANYGGSACFFIRSYRMDGLFYDSTSACAGTDSYALAISTPQITADVNYFEIYLYATANTSGLLYLKDLNILYKNYRNPYVFNYYGTGTHSIQYYSTDTSDLNEEIKTSSFITYGSMHFYFKDENNGANLTGVTVYNPIIDANVVLTDRNYDFNLAGITAGNYTFKFYKSGYSMRQWQMDINEFTDFNKTVMLLPDINSQRIDFQFYAPNQTALLANSYIDINNSRFGAWTERLKTDSEGRVSFTVNSDSNNYYFTIVTPEGIQYVYRNTVLTVEKPREETTGNTIPCTNWSVNVSGGLAALSDGNIAATSNKTMLIYSNTVLTYRIAVDANSPLASYDARSYYLRVTGQQNTYTLSPYLLLTSDAALIKFIAINKSTQKPTENIDLSFYRIITGGKKLVASASTDISGAAVVSLAAGATYSITLTRNGVIFYSSDNLSIGSSPIYIYLSENSAAIYNIDTNAPRVYWDPAPDYMPAGTVGVKQTITGSNISWVQVSFYQYKDFNMLTGRTVLKTVQSACGTGGCEISTTLASLGYDTNKPFFVDVNVYTDSNAYVLKTTHKYIGAPSKGIDLIKAFKNVKNDFGCSADPLLPCGIGIIVSVILTVLAVAFLIFKTGITSPIPIVIVGLFLLGVFTFIEWFYLPMFALVALAGIFSIYRSIVTAG